jgi:hypothetical protein
MDFLMILAAQPLFRLIGAIIVLLITDYRPAWGLVAGIVWITWVTLPYWFKKPIKR